MIEAGVDKQLAVSELVAELMRLYGAAGEPAPAPGRAYTGRSASYVGTALATHGENNEKRAFGVFIASVAIDEPVTPPRDPVMIKHGRVLQLWIELYRRYRAAKKSARAQVLADINRLINTADPLVSKETHTSRLAALSTTVDAAVKATE